jgi:hypothetical protein
MASTNISDFFDDYKNAKSCYAKRSTHYRGLFGKLESATPNTYTTEGGLNTGSSNDVVGDAINVTLRDNEAECFNNLNNILVSVSDASITSVSNDEVKLDDHAEVDYKQLLQEGNIKQILNFLFDLKMLKLKNSRGDFEERRKQNLERCVILPVINQIKKAVEQDDSSDVKLVKMVSAAEDFFNDADNTNFKRATYADNSESLSYTKIEERINNQFQLSLEQQSTTNDKERLFKKQKAVVIDKMNKAIANYQAKTQKTWGRWLSSCFSYVPILSCILDRYHDVYYYAEDVQNKLREGVRTLDDTNSMDDIKAKVNVMLSTVHGLRVKTTPEWVSDGLDGTPEYTSDGGSYIPIAVTVTKDRFTSTEEEIKKSYADYDISL